MNIENRVQPFIAKNIRNRHSILDAALNYKPFVFAAFTINTVTTYITSRFDQSPKVQEAIEKYQPENISFFDRLKREMIFFQRSRLFDIGARAANGLRWKTANLGTEYGRNLTKIYTEFKYRDHGHEHYRRVKDFIKLVFLNSPEVDIEWRPAVDALASVSHSHDVVQAMIKVWNNEKNIHLDEKKGHDLAAAIVALASFREYAKERGISEDEAWRIKCAEAYLIIGHDDGDSLKKQFSARKRADEKEYNEESDSAYSININLVQDYKKGLIDKSTLSPCQILKLMVYELQENSIIARLAGQDSKYGLLPDLEKQLPILNEFLTLPKYKKAMFEKLSSKERVSLENAYAIFVLADRMDMFAPFPETTCRKFTVQRSKQRFFMRGTKDEIIEQLQKGEFHHSDVHRMLFEIMTVSEIYNDTPLQDCRFVKNITKQHQIAALLHLQKFGERFMQGGNQAIAVLDEIYDRRTAALGEKVLRKLKLSTTVDFKAFESMTDVHARLMEVKRLVEKFGTGETAQRFLAAFNELHNEEEEIYRCILAKPENKNMGKIFQYSQEQRLAFNEICQHFYRELLQSNNLTQDELMEIELLVAQGNTPPLGYSTFDSSSSGMENMKTLISNRESVFVKLMLLHPVVRQFIRTGEIIQERSKHSALVRKSIFQSLGFGYLLTEKQDLPDEVDYRLHTALQRIKTGGYNSDLIRMIDQVIEQSPSDTPSIGVLNESWALLGFPKGRERDFQNYAWERLESVYGDDGKARFLKVKDFVQKGYAKHVPRKTGDQFINHPLAVLLLDLQDHDNFLEKSRPGNEGIEIFEIEISHDLVEDNSDAYAFVETEKGYRIIDKNNHNNFLDISKTQFTVLNALTRRKGRENEWLNQILQLPLNERAIAAKAKINEILHNLFTGKYDNFIDAIKRTEEQERTLFILSLSSVFSLRHPFRTAKEMFGFLRGFGSLERLKIMTPTLCASFIKQLYLFEAEKIFSAGINRPVESENQTDRSQTHIAEILREIYWDEDFGSYRADRFDTGYQRQNTHAFFGQRYYQLLYPTGTLLNNFMARNGLGVNTQVTDKMARRFIPLRRVDLLHWVSHINLYTFGYTSSPNNRELGSLSKLWYPNNAVTRFVIAYGYWLDEQKKKKLLLN